MQRFLSRLLAGIRKLGRQRPARRPQRLHLTVETLEDRLVPSTVVPKLAVPLTGPALVAPAAETSGGHVVAEPDRPVHGYKWRPWRPRANSDGQSSVQRTEMVQGSHLVVGGNDGLTASISSAGHIVVQPPEGPPPTEFPFGKV
jgi:hypothetical protein